MAKTNEKSRLRKFLLDSRDSLSDDFIDISSQTIAEKLKKLRQYKKAVSISCYFAIGSEVKTHSVITEILDSGKDLALPKVKGRDLELRKITDLEDLEVGSFSIREPKEKCPKITYVDTILVPAIAVTKHGYRLGYGYGYYDRLLSRLNTSNKICLEYSKQIISSMPVSDNDIRMDCIITEKEVINTRQK